MFHLIYYENKSNENMDIGRKMINWMENKIKLSSVEHGTKTEK